jgi:hypothetical protein
MTLEHCSICLQQSVNFHPYYGPGIYSAHNGKYRSVYKARPVRNADLAVNYEPII